MYLSNKKVNAMCCILLLFGVASDGYGRDVTGYKPSELLQEIKRSEETIQDVQAYVKWWQPDTGMIFKDFEWGYEKGKEFVKGTKYMSTTREKSRSNYNFAFDGETQFHFRYTEGVNRAAGKICALEPELWNAQLTPAVLLGYGLNWWGRQSLADFLATTTDLRVSETRSVIDGHSCVLMEAVGLSYRSPKDNTFSYDIKVWIDPQRDFRPLKMEKYKHAEGDSENAERNRWKKLVRRIDNIKLEKFAGIWVPISGDRQMFRNTVAGPEGMSKEEFREKYVDQGYTEDDLFKMGILREVNEPSSAKRRIEISNVKMNEGIDPQAFAIQFPPGCAVWDDFTQMGYTVGGSKVFDASYVDTPEPPNKSANVNTQSSGPDKNEKKAFDVQHENDATAEIAVKHSSGVLKQALFVCAILLIIGILVATVCRKLGSR